MHTGIKYDITRLGCAFLTIELFLNFWRIFEIMVYDMVNVKCLFSYSFSRIVFLFHTGIKYDITYLGCASIDNRTIFEFLANF